MSRKMKRESDMKNNIYGVFLTMKENLAILTNQEWRNKSIFSQARVLKWKRSKFWILISSLGLLTIYSTFKNKP